MALKVAVVGGGSTYTPELVEGFLAHSARLPVDELVLHDIDAERLQVVGGLARRIMQKHGWPGQLVLTQDRDRAIDGAGFVIVQLRVGGQAARLLDETLPLERVHYDADLSRRLHDAVQPVQHRHVDRHAPLQQGSVLWSVDAIHPIDVVGGR